ncbi:terpene synthase family protein [Nocardia sp. NBC_01730]|uniref:terpene synthase family protein n=1 Tax=Nocardia sp. NBC_01730 TaxID=2975998 RepID=UPI002E1389FD|nr:terpene synthase family protein [Nocardia sp. NBC_01730]
MDALIDSTVTWVRKFGFARDVRQATLLATAGVGFTVCAYHYARPEVLEYLCRYGAWGFYLDDICETRPYTERLPELTQLLTRLTRVVEVPASQPWGHDPFLDAGRDLTTCIARHTSPTLMRRLSDSFRQWMFGNLTEVSQRSLGYPADLDAYLRLRAGAVGGENGAAMGEVALGLELPSQERDQPAVRAACEAAILTASLDNDRFSFAKSVRLDEGSPDIITMIQRENPSLSFPEALAAAVAVRDRCFSRYLALRTQLLPDGSAELRRYFIVLDALVAGNLVFGSIATRYFSPNSPTADLPWSDTPSDLNPDPLPVPAIAWWWDV